METVENRIKISRVSICIHIRHREEPTDTAQASDLSSQWAAVRSLVTCGDSGLRSALRPHSGQTEMRWEGNTRPALSLWSSHVHNVSSSLSLLSVQPKSAMTDLMKRWVSTVWEFSKLKQRNGRGASSTDRKDPEPCSHVVRICAPWTKPKPWGLQSSL